MKRVYTFATTPHRESIYLDAVSSTIQGVKTLIRDSDELWLDKSQSIVDILIDDTTISVKVFDSDVRESYVKKLYLISFKCI